MLLSGDEISRTQNGNNNAYCQDNEIGWVNWSLSDDQREMLNFVQRLVKLRNDHPVLRRRRFFEGQLLPGSDIKDITWFKLDGTEVMDGEWNDAEARTLGMRISGQAMDEADPHGAPIADDTLLLLLSSYHEELPFVLPEGGGDSMEWEVVLDTDQPDLFDDPTARFEVGEEYPLRGRSLALLRRIPPDETLVELDVPEGAPTTSSTSA